MAKKLAIPNLVLQAFERFIGTFPKKINSQEGFLEKRLFCTFSSINSEFGALWGILWIFFYCLFMMLQKNAFGQKKSNFMHKFKSAILEKLKNCNNDTFELVHEIQKLFWPKAFF